MKRLLSSVWIIILFAVVFMTVLSCEVKEPTTTDKIKGSQTTEKGKAVIKGNGRAISLRVLQEKVKDCISDGTCPENILQLGGIKKITGYVIDKKNRDLILIGNVDDTSPALYLEDFMIALRNTWMKYAELKGNTYYYSNPGCSIDPDASVLKALQQAGDKIFNNPDPADVQKNLNEWHSICGQHQQVQVFGIPHDTRFSEIMVEADYYMKRLVDGSVTLDIEGFTSLTDMALSTIREDIAQGRQISIPLVSLNRFWFYPGKNSFLEDEGVIFINRSDVKLLNEEEFLTKKGEMVGTGRPDPLAQRFAENFSAKYAPIAEQKPIYAELEGLFRFVALARIIKYKKAISEAGINLDYLLNECPIQNIHVNRTLPGISNIKEFTHKSETRGGYSVLYLWLPSCGGVSIDLKITENNISKDGSGRMARMRNAVLSARQSYHSLFWDFPFSA